MNKITPFLIAFLMLIVSNFAQSQVVINEILTSNTAINQDEDATYQDWIEFRNNGATTVNLTGYGLTDDALLPFKWTFPNVSIASGQYLLVWCSSKNKVIPGNPLHTNFKLSASGDVILFSSPAGAIINSIPATYLPENVSYGRLPNGTGSFVYFSAVTPSAANGAVGYNQVLPPPTFSQASGVLTAGFNLTISTIITGATILYTLDGSEPKATNLGGTTYTYKNKYSELVGQATGYC
jgi:Lamin Tail Domain/Chitobiase/beta-hexosaminidase C-terminal domain